MPTIDDTFWTDDQQAYERLRRSVVIHDNRPVYVHNVHDGKALVSSKFYTPRGQRLRIPLNDAGWNKFRTLPRVGWYNELYNGRYSAVYVKRQAYRGRTHGFAEANTQFYAVDVDRTIRVERNLMTLVTHCVSFGMKGKYPTMKTVLSRSEARQTQALSPKWALRRGLDNDFTLFRKLRKVGTYREGVLHLDQGLNYLVEEIQQDPCLPIDTIQGG